MKYNLEKFKQGLVDLNLTLTDEQLNQFMTYYELLVETNKVMNLTAITEFEEVIEKHFLAGLPDFEPGRVFREFRLRLLFRKLSSSLRIP